MAGTTHYFFECMDPDAVLWRVEIKDTTYAGTDAVDFTGLTGGDGFTFNISETDSLIKASDFECSIDLGVESLALFDAIIAGPDCRFIVLIYKAGAIFWRGFISQDSMSKPDAGNGTEFLTLTASDGFGLLKDILYTGYDINNLVRYNYPDWMQIIAAYLPLNYDAINTNVFSFASIWYEDSMDSSVVSEPEYSNPLASTYINESAFLLTDEYGVVEAANLYDILNALLSIQNLQLSQCNGVYLFIQENTFIQAQTRAWSYDKSGTFQSSALLSLQSAIPVRFSGGSYTYILPIKQVTTEYEYRQGIYRNNLFPYNVDRTTEYNLGLSVQNAEITFNGRIETIYNGTGGDPEFIQAVYKLLIQNGTKYLNQNASGELEWTTSSANFVPVLTRSFKSDYAGDQVMLTDFAISTLLPEEGEPITFEWQYYRLENYGEGTLFDDSAVTYTLAHDDIEGTFIARINSGVPMEGKQLFKATVANSARADIELDAVGLGDGVNKYSAGALYVRDTADKIVESNAWTIYSEIGGTAYPVNSLRCRESLAQNRATVEVYNGTLKGSPDFHKALTFDGKQYVLKSISWDCFAGEYSFTAFVIYPVRTAITVDAVLTAQDETTSGSSTSSGSNGTGSVSVSNPLVDDILDFRDNAYKPYTAKKSSDPGYPYFYINSGTSYPTFNDVLSLDAILEAYQLEVNRANINVDDDFYTAKLTYESLILEWEYLTFNTRVTLLNATDEAQLFAVDLSDNSSLPVIIGTKNITGNYNGQYLSVDDKNEEFIIHFTNTKAYGLLMSTNVAEDQYSALNVGDFTQRKSTAMINQSTYNSDTELTSSTNIFNRIVAYSKLSNIYGQFKEIINAAENWTTSSRAVEWIIETVVSGATTLSRRLRIDKDGYFYIGSATNNTSFSPTGTQRMNGTATVFNDLNIPGLAVKTSGSSDPALDTFGSTTRIFTFSGSTMNQVFFTVQLPHSYKEGSAIEPHIHWCPMTSPASSLGVRWGLDYQWQNYTGVFTATDTSLLATGGTGTVGYTHLITSFGTITGTSKTISSVLVCRLYRLPADGADTYTGDAGFLSFDFHIESDSLGSETEYGK